MLTLNENFLHLQQNYLFADIAHRVADFQQANPDVRLIRLGIGDVTQPLAPAVIAALHRAVDEQASAETFRGYGPEQGYLFLRQAIVEGDYASRGLDISPEEVFINDGAKSDTGNFTDILGRENTVLVTDPVYPVYVDSNTMSGRSITYAPCTEEGGFVPALPPADAPAPALIYLCYPNNPTGTTLTASQLQEWVDYALAHGSLLLYDSAYEAYISSPSVPHSIYELPGARRCAVEFRSFSKTAGFTGLRCGYTVVPHDIVVPSSGGTSVRLSDLWRRRQSTKFNGTPYIVQRAAESIYTPEGRAQVRATIAYYMENARIMRESLIRLGLHVYGGKDAPYLWVPAPQGMDSWTFFGHLLHEAHVVTTPGVGFGPSGEGFIRLTAFGHREDCLEAMERIGKWLACPSIPFQPAGEGKASSMGGI